MAVVALGESDLAAPGLLYYLFAYLAMNVGAFGRRHRASRPRRDRALTGLARAQPWLVAAMLLFLSLIGIPPLAGFVGKFTAFGAVIDAGFAWLAGIAAAATLASIYPYARLIAPTYLAIGIVSVMGRRHDLAMPPTSRASRPALLAGATLPGNSRCAVRDRRGLKSVYDLCLYPLFRNVDVAPAALAFPRLTPEIPADVLRDRRLLSGLAAARGHKADTSVVRATHRDVACRLLTHPAGGAAKPDFEISLLRGCLRCLKRRDLDSLLVERGLSPEPTPSPLRELGFKRSVGGPRRRRHRAIWSRAVRARPGP